MKIDQNILTSAKMPSRLRILGTFAGLSLAALPGVAQQIPAFSGAAPMLVSGSLLPDSPGTVAEESSTSSSSLVETPASADFAPTTATMPMASHTDKYIAPGQAVPMLSVKDKFALGVKDAVSPFSAVGWLISAGYAQALNGSPNYGTNATAFAQRFGAAAARATSEGIFSDSVMDSVLHEDPRYYRMGPGHNFIKRLVYSGTRAIVTRTDGGRSTPNFALLAGNLGGSYLTKAYYPPLNTSNVEVFKTFGGSIGGSALGFVVSEFLPGGFNLFHGSRKTSN